MWEKSSLTLSLYEDGFGVITLFPLLLFLTSTVSVCGVWVCLVFEVFLNKLHKVCFIHLSPVDL